MSFIYYDPIVTKRRGDNQEPLISKTDIKKIINGRIILDEIPDSFNKCNVTCSVGGVVYTWYEISSGIPTLDAVGHTGTFLVNYLRGYIDFPSGTNGETATISSMGSGCHYFPASRVYTDYDDNGNGNYNIVETLQELCDSVSGLSHEGIYSASTTYSLNNIVTYGNFSYISIQNTNLNHTPVGDITDTYWQLLSGINNFEYKGNWNGTTQYYKNNIILYTTNNSSYICILDVLSATTPVVDTTHWKPLADLTSINTAETTRINAENERISAESTRGTNESTRVSNETTRINSENTRISQETTRINAEAARVAGGALIKSGDTMMGNITMSNDKGIIFGGHIKFSYNASLGTVDITTV